MNYFIKHIEPSVENYPCPTGRAIHNSIHYKTTLRIISFMLGFFLLNAQSEKLSAQGLQSFFSSPKADSQFIRTYKHFLTGRTYFSKKYTSVGIGGSSRYPSFRYRPNTTLNFGLGLTYDAFTLNLAYGFPFLNTNHTQRGKTKYLDLQSHIYSRKFVTDIFGQFYKGFYIAPKNFVPNMTGYYSKPDLGVSLIGFSTYYIFNPGKFSYQAALIQNEWQTKSSGTFLGGLDFHYGILSSDELLLPEELKNAFPQETVRRLRFVTFGPGLGYAYNFIYKKHWFATASLTGTLTINFTKESSAFSDRAHIGISPNFLYRLGIGYNSNTWECVFTLVNSSVQVAGAYSSTPYSFRTGNYRLTLARRFKLSKRVRQKMKPVIHSITP
ncbi:MAG TPA: DUF4421 domain-containing protein [Edaphocola sp.]|nr:DUF4421 domain-containing protein [Edaphocola sp.]